MPLAEKSGHNDSAGDRQVVGSEDLVNPLGEFITGDRVGNTHQGFPGSVFAVHG